MTCLKDERGQSIILTAFLFLGLATFGFFLVINANDFYNDTASTRQAMARAARDGATQVDLGESLSLTPIEDPDAPLPAIPESRHCLDPVRAEAKVREALEQNLAVSGGLYVKADGSPLTPAEIAQDTSGTYIVELTIVNPPALNCPTTGLLPTYPAGVSYDFTRPYVHIAARLPMQALYGAFQVSPVYVVAVTNATDPKGGR
jgi:hypothetical protein